MSNFTKVFLIFLLVLVGFYFRDTIFGENSPLNIKIPEINWNIKNPFQKERITDNTAKIDVLTQKEVEEIAKREEIKPKEMVIIYFISDDNNGNRWFTKSIRPLPQGETKISYAIKNLMQGPKKAEKDNGVYSEIPSSAKLLSIKEMDNKIIINLSNDFQYGGGADSLYSRVKQLIKTSLANSPNKPVYLYIEGKQANVIGGEGIMINQPLNENSLDD